MDAVALVKAPPPVNSLTAGWVCFFSFVSFSLVSRAKMTSSPLLTRSSLADINLVCMGWSAFLKSGKSFLSYRLWLLALATDHGGSGFAVVFTAPLGFALVPVLFAL